MRKSKYLIFVCIVISFFISINNIDAKTLRDVKAEVEAAEKALKENQNKQNETEGEMRDIQGEVHDNLVEVDDIMKNITLLNEEIESLNKQIAEKEEEIKRLLNFVQKTEGNNAYLEYIFGAESFEDLIYRIAVAEQLSNYNSKLVDDYNELITKNEKSKKVLEQKKEDLINKRAQLEKKYSELSTSLREIEDAEPTLEEAVKLQREIYNFYVDLGCELDDDLDTCGNKLLPPSNTLYRPLTEGYFSYGWGNRCYWLRGKQVCDFHKGVDLAKNGSAVPVYSVGVGRVVGVVAKPNAWSCGGQVVFISHNVNGQYYTSTYMHLRKIFVKEGDIVDANTMIAYMGGSPGIETYDTCTNGQHLHLSISEGMFTTWAKAKANQINPATVINFPKVKSSWTNRTKVY